MKNSDWVPSMNTSRQNSTGMGIKKNAGTKFPKKVIKKFPQRKNHKSMKGEEMLNKLVHGIH